MAKYIIRRISNKTVLSQAGINEMTDIMDTQEKSSGNVFLDKALDPEAIVRGTAGIDFVRGRESVNPEYGMFHGAPGEGMPREFKLTPQEMDFLNKNPTLKRDYETKKIRDFLQQEQKSQLNQIIPKLESLYAIYRSAPYGFALDKLKQEARMIRQLSPTDKAYLMTKPYWPLIKDIVK